MLRASYLQQRGTSGTQVSKITKNALWKCVLQIGIHFSTLLLNAEEYKAFMIISNNFM